MIRGPISPQSAGGQEAAASSNPPVSNQEKRSVQSNLDAKFDAAPQDDPYDPYNDATTTTATRSTTIAPTTPTPQLESKKHLWTNSLGTDGASQCLKKRFFN